MPADALTLLEAGLPDRDVSRIEQKQRIAAAAVDLLPRADSTVILDAGSTTIRLARLLPSNLRITRDHPRGADRGPAGRIAADRAARAARPRTPPHARGRGPGDGRGAGPVRADLAFVGTNGLTVEHGLSTPDRTEAAVKRAIIERARRTVVLADSSKIGVERTIKFAELSDVDALVTDKEITASDRRAIEKAGVEVITA